MLKRILVLAVVMVTASMAYAGDIVLDLRGDGVDTNNLVSGQNFDVLVSLAAPQGQEIASIRMMQMDHRDTVGSSVDDFTWDIEGIDDSLYFKEKFNDIPTVVRANYVLGNPVSGFILDLTDQPTRIGRYNLTFSEAGELNLVGPPNDDGNRDAGLYFQSGFGGDLETYFVTKGNILPGGDSSSAGVLPLIPEPASLGLLGIGALMVLRRRRNK